MILSLLLAAVTAPQLDTQKSFGDWAVACDNVKRCEMTSLLPESAPDDPAWQDLRVSVVRDAGGVPSLEVSLQGEHRGRVEVRIDGKAVGGGTLDGGNVTLPGAAAVEAMAAGKQFAVTDAAGKVVGRVSLAGSSAALRFIDAEQGLAGTTGALVAKGAKPAAVQPRALPVVTYVRPPAGPAPKLTPALRKTMMTLSKCDDETTGASQEAESYRLDARATLVLLPCGAGAYNFNTVPFVVVAGRPVIAKFDAAIGWSTEDPVPMLVNATFDPKTARLGSYAKGRGVGDCGSAEAFVWDGGMFRLVEAKAMGDCRGSINWLTIWRAEARPR